MPVFEIQKGGKTFEVDAPTQDAALKALATMDAPPPNAAIAAPADTRSATERFLSPMLPSTTPSDYINGPLYAVKHPIDSAKLIGGAIAADPVGAIPVVGNVKRAIQDVGTGNYAGAAGEITTAALPLLLKEVRNPVGKATAATGAALERVADSKAVKNVSGMASAGEAVMKGNYGAAAGALMIPPAINYLGKGMRTIGELLQSTDSLNSKEIAMLKVKLSNPALANNPMAKSAIMTAIRTRGGVAVEPAPLSAMDKLLATKSFKKLGAQ